MDYNIQKDVQLVREFFNLSQNQFADLVGIDRIAVSRIETGATHPRIELLNKIYNYCFDKGLKLNLQKEMLYKDDITNGHILLSHGSKYGIEGEISISKSRNNNDFGKGFYCGDSYDGAISFVCKYDNPSIYFVELDPLGLKKKEYEVNIEWMLTIAYYRGKLNSFSNCKTLNNILNPLKKVDYIVAPIADNRIFQIIDSFIDGEITDEQCKHCLAATNLGKQYVFLTDKSLKNIKVLERLFVPSKEKTYYQNEQLSYQKTGYDKSKLARIQYRGKGKYIEEILI